MMEVIGKASVHRAGHVVAVVKRSSLPRELRQGDQIIDDRGVTRWRLVSTVAVGADANQVGLLLRGSVEPPVGERLRVCEDSGDAIWITAEEATVLLELIQKAWQQPTVRWLGSKDDLVRRLKQVLRAMEG